MTSYASPAPPMRAARHGLLWSRAWLPAAALFAGAALISVFSIRNGVDPFDGGLMLQAARRIGSGQLPYRDFLWAYGPAQPYLLAALFKLLGTSLLQWRIVLVLANAGISLVAWLLVRGRAPVAVALGVWLAVATEIAEPRSADPFPLALLAVLLALLIATGGPANAANAGPAPPGPAPPGAAKPGMVRALGAGLLVAVAAAFRLDFGLYGLAGVAIALAARGAAGDAVAKARRRAGWPADPGWRAWLAPVAAAVAVAVGVGVLVYLPFALAIGPRALYHALIGNSLATRDYWTLPFPLHFHAPPGAGTAKTLKKALDFYVPLLLLAGFALAALGALAEWGREREAPARALGLLAVGAGLVAYMTSRPDPNHAQPLFVVVAVTLGLVVGRVPAGGRAGAATGRVRAHRAPRPRLLAVLALALLALLDLHGVGNRLSALVHPPPVVALRIAVADGVEAPPAEARAIDAMVALVDSRVPPGAPIYVLPRRSDLVTFSDPLIYVMTQRPNPTGQDFGLQAGAAAQARIVSALARIMPRALVRWTDPLSSRPEPNLRGRSTGVHTLDDWVAAHYRVLARLYHYTVLVPR